MSLHSLSISNSNTGTRRGLGGAFGTVAWAIIWLAALDILISVLFAYPNDPKTVHASRLQLYFDYGRSTEAKLARMTRSDPSRTAPITLSGWYDPLIVQETAKSTDASVVAFYGMSHAVQLANALERTSDKFTARIVGAPGATANWAYGAYLRDRGGGKSQVAVLALMSANLAMITTMSAMTWNVAFPMPYTSDRFFVDNDRLRVVHPPYSSFAQYVRTFSDPEMWASALGAIAQNDPIYSPFIMQASVLDHSSLFRLVRRAYAQRLERSERKKVISQSGFNADSEQIKVANAIVKEFSSSVREDGAIPIIFLVNNLGYSDSLFQALRVTLETSRIPYLSSHEFVSPSDPRGYLPNSHFVDEIDDRMARGLVKIIENSR